jgi:hypothetical protein
VNNVQKNKLTKGVFLALLLISTVAGADQQYPAADFQPTIVYQDSNIAKANTAPAAAAKAAPIATAEIDSKYPAANFQPKVVYSDPQAQHSNAAATQVANAASVKSVSSKSTEADAKYPAANFQPQVVYSDANYKSSSSASNSESKIQDTTVEVSGTAAKANESDSSYLIALIGLVAAGFFFFKNQSNSEIGTENVKASTAAKVSGGSTGVARYLNRISGTGVSRYLEKQAKIQTPVTGVAKYMAKQVISAKAEKAEAATGVEKYMRDRG